MRNVGLLDVFTSPAADTCRFKRESMGSIHSHRRAWAQGQRKFPGKWLIIARRAADPGARPQSQIPRGADSAEAPTGAMAPKTRLQSRNSRIPTDAEAEGWLEGVNTIFICRQDHQFARWMARYTNGCRGGRLVRGREHDLHLPPRSSIRKVDGAELGAECLLKVRYCLHGVCSCLWHRGAVASSRAAALAMFRLARRDCCGARFDHHWVPATAGARSAVVRLDSSPRTGCGRKRWRSRRPPEDTKHQRRR